MGGYAGTPTMPRKGTFGPRNKLCPLHSYGIHCLHNSLSKILQMQKSDARRPMVSSVGVVNCKIKRCLIDWGSSSDVVFKESYR